MKKLNVLIACEESQRICSEFRKLGHNAYSCDLQKCSGGHPEWHIHGDCLPVLELSEKRYFFGEPVPVFYTQDGERHILPNHKWDLIIAHPTCTYLSRAGERLMSVERYGDYAKDRLKEREKAIEFFMKFTSLSCEHVAIENPIGCMEKRYRRSDQTVQPWMFGDNVRKSTCLWLKNLPPLVPEITEQPELDLVSYEKDGRVISVDRMFKRTRRLPEEERRRERSKTFPGIARAIAKQWSDYLLSIAS